MELNNEAYQGELGILPSDWKENRGPYIRLHLDYPYGRKWWSHQRQRMLVKPSLGPVVTMIDRALSEQTKFRFKRGLSAVPPLSATFTCACKVAE